MPEISLGLIPGYGGTKRLPRLVGQAKALQMVLTGKPIKADEALQRGLVYKVVEQEKLVEDGREGLAAFVEKREPKFEGR